MTASVGREVHRNRLSMAALRGAVTRAEAEDAGGEDFGDLGEAVGGGETARFTEIKRGAMVLSQINSPSPMFLFYFYSCIGDFLPVGGEYNLCCAVCSGMDAPEN